MMRIVIATFVAALLLFGQGAAVAPDDRSLTADMSKLPPGPKLIEFADTIKPSVVTVVAVDRDGKDVAMGTGVLLAGDLIITNHQVIARGASARIELDPETTAPVASVVTSDHATNLVVVKADFSGIDMSGHTPLTIAEKNPEKDHEVLLVINPDGKRHQVAMGTVHGIDAREDIPAILRVQTRYATGSTGGPLVNGAREIAGIAAYAKVNGATEKFAIPAQSVRALVASMDDTVPMSLTDYMAASKDTLDGNDAAALARINPEDIKLEATIETQEDGSLLIDGQYVVKGAGTKEDPYRITWDLLVSAAKVYQPREGFNELPERITFLHEKWVRLSGFVAFQLGAVASDELLLMLNQWDGCCIGVPPTPYDAVEVTLAEKIKAESGINVFNYGAVTGQIKVDPYVVNNWLVGLYLMESAELRLEM